MKTIIALLVMVAAMSAESFQWPWSSIEVPASWQYAWVSTSFDGLEYVSYVDVYTMTQTAADSLHLFGTTGIGVSPVYGSEMDKLSIIEDSLGYRVRFECEDEKPGALYVAVYGGESSVDKIRATNFAPETTHTYTNGAWQCYEISLIICGGLTSLQRDTWASIKTSF